MPAGLYKYGNVLLQSEYPKNMVYSRCVHVERDARPITFLLGKVWCFRVAAKVAEEFP